MLFFKNRIAFVADDDVVDISNWLPTYVRVVMTFGTEAIRNTPLLFAKTACTDES